MRMTQEEKQLLLQDLCPRLKYGVVYHRNDGANIKLNAIDVERSLLNYTDDIDERECKPYLRPMVSMTEEERNEYAEFKYVEHHEWDGHTTYTEYIEVEDINNYFVWLNKNMFDYRGLIENGLALEAPEGMYK